MKRIFIVLLVLFAVLILAGGGYYYYFQIYQPEQYKKAVSPLYDKIGLQMARPSLPEIQDRADFFLALDILEESKTNLEKVRKDFAELQPTKNKKIKEFHQNFNDGLALSFLSLNESKMRVNFWLKTDDLLKDLKKIRSSSEEAAGMREKIRTVRDLRNFWNPPFQKIKSLGEETFTPEIASLKEPALEEILSRWEETEKGIDYILSLLNTLSPALLLEQINSVLSSEQSRKSEESFRSVNKFIEFLESKIKKGGAYNISGLDNFSKQAELSELSFKIYRQIEDFKKKE